MDSNMIFESLKVHTTSCAGTGRGKKFNEAEDAENEKAGVPVGIVVRSGDIVDAIGTVYEGDTVRLKGNVKGGGGHKIIFDKDDTLLSIEGVCDVNYAGNRTLSQIVIHTRKGKQYGPFGNRKDGKKFSLPLPPGEAVFIGLYGVADSVSVNQLGMIYVEYDAPQLGEDIKLPPIPLISANASGKETQEPQPIGRPDKATPTPTVKPPKKK